MPAGDAADSFSNLVNVRDGAGDIGIARSDWQYFAVTGSGPVKFMSGNFDDDPQPVCDRHPALHPARQARCRDRRDRGPEGQAGQHRPAAQRQPCHHGPGDGGPGPGPRTTSSWPRSWPPRSSPWRSATAGSRPSAYDVSHPDPAVEHVTKLCDAEIVPVGGEAVDKLLEATPYLGGHDHPRRALRGRGRAGADIRHDHYPVQLDRRAGGSWFMRWSPRCSTICRQLKGALSESASFGSGADAQRTAFRHRCMTAPSAISKSKA